MIHYHGTPITPRERLLELAGRHFCVSFSDPRDARTCHEIGQSVMLDNGAFTAWTQGREVDWCAWATWAEEWLDYPTTWCVLPDSVDGGIEENDRLFLSRLGDRIIGARIVAVEPHDYPLVRVEFEHKGTDDNAGYLIVGPSCVFFDSAEGDSGC